MGENKKLVSELEEKDLQNVSGGNDVPEPEEFEWGGGAGYTTPVKEQNWPSEEVRERYEWKNRK